MASLLGAREENRTPMVSPPADFESENGRGYNQGDFNQVIENMRIFYMYI